MDDVVLNKAATVERSIARVLEEYGSGGDPYASSITRQDAVALNLLRACEAAIEIGARVVRLHGLGIPQSSRDLFSMLHEAGHLPRQNAEDMRRMVGFRNIAVHDYTALRIEIVEKIITQHLDSLREFVRTMLQAM